MYLTECTDKAPTVPVSVAISCLSTCTCQPITKGVTAQFLYPAEIWQELQPRIAKQLGLHGPFRESIVCKLRVSPKSVYQENHKNHSVLGYSVLIVEQGPETRVSTAVG